MKSSFFFLKVICFSKLWYIGVTNFVIGVKIGCICRMRNSDFVLVLYYLAGRQEKNGCICFWGRPCWRVWNSPYSRWSEVSFHGVDSRPLLACSSHDGWFEVLFWVVWHGVRMVLKEEGMTVFWVPADIGCTSWQARRGLVDPSGNLICFEAHKGIFVLQTAM